MMWTTKELERLRDLYPKLTLSELELAFHPRTADSITSMAKYIGVRKRRDWRQICAGHTPHIHFRSIVEES
jgi:hypothetical protein